MAETLEKECASNRPRVIIDADSAEKMRAEVVAIKRMCENAKREHEADIKRSLGRKREQERIIEHCDRSLKLFDLLPTETEQP